MRIGDPARIPRNRDSKKVQGKKATLSAALLQADSALGAGLEYKLSYASGPTDPR